MTTPNENHTARLSPPGNSHEDSYLGPIPAPDPLPMSDSLSPVSLPDKTERECYYYGLPSRPNLLARSSSKPWALPYGPYQCPEPKFLKNIGHHPKLQQSWASMYPFFYDILDKYKILWTSIETWRIGTHENDMDTIVWIGIKPSSLTDEVGNTLPIAGTIVVHCKQVLRDHGIYDIECELKESESYRGAYGRPYRFRSPVVDIDVFFTSTIGTCIGSLELDKEGTFGFYLRFPAHPGRLFGVTCRHVLFDIEEDNELYHRKNKRQRARPVLLPGDKFLQLQQEKAEKSIEGQNIIKEVDQREIEYFQGYEDRDSKTARVDAETSLKKADKAIKDLEHLIENMTTNWSTRDSRTIGHVVFSPPIKTTSHPTDFTTDWCLYEVDESKLTDFEGNVVDLGTETSIDKLTTALNPNLQDPEGFKYPAARQLHIQNNIVPIAEIYNPQDVNRENLPGLHVGKRGRTTGVTVGVANEVESYVRNYFSDGSSFVAKELAFLGASPSFTTFSDCGDSGALVWDSKKRAVAILTGGSGYSDKTDISYGTPIEALFEDMKRYGWRNPTFKVVGAKYPKAAESV